MKINWETVDVKCEQELEKVFCLCKEGVEKGARDELFEKVQCVNRYVIGQLVLQEPVISVLRKELRKMADGILVETEEVENILRAGVLRGDVMAEDEPEVQNAVHRVSKFYRQAAKKCEKKPAEKKDEPPPAPVTEQKLSLTEQLLQEVD